EPRGLAHRNRHAEEVGPIVLVQHPRAGKLCRIRQEHAADRGERVPLSATQELEGGVRSRGIDKLRMFEVAQSQGRSVITHGRDANARSVYVRNVLKSKTPPAPKRCSPIAESAARSRPRSERGRAP